MSKSVPELAVVIVNWNTRQLTLDAIQALKTDLAARDDSPETAIWVVDNASGDNSADAIARRFPDVHLIRSTENLGFAGGNNRALYEIGFDTPDRDKYSLPAAVYLLNSDTLSQPGATATLYHTLFSLEDAGVVGARLTYGDGSFQHSAFAFPGLSQLWIDLLPAPARLHESHLNGRYSRELYAGDEPFLVGHTLGATMMLRREVIQQTGMFDEQFFMYAEEVDWSWRIQKAGWQIYCVPTAHVIHLEGQSTRQVRPRSVVNLWQSRLRLFRKHYPFYKRWLAHWIIRPGMYRKMRQTRRLYTEHEISAKERDALLEAYRQVIREVNR